MRQVFEAIEREIKNQPVSVQAFILGSAIGYCQSRLKDVEASVGNKETTEAKL
jgi:hypothetical protein